MNYIITKLLTEEGTTSFYILGQSDDRKRAARIAAEAYTAYNRTASFRNVEMVTEWLETRQEYSFRKDSRHRLQLAITPLPGELAPEGGQLVYSASAEEEELMRKVSRALIDGKHAAEKAGAPSSCPAK